MIGNLHPFIGHCLIMIGNLHPFIGHCLIPLDPSLFLQDVIFGLCPMENLIFSPIQQKYVDIAA